MLRRQVAKMAQLASLPEILPGPNETVEGQVRWPNLEILYQEEVRGRVCAQEIPPSN